MTTQRRRRSWIAQYTLGLADIGRHHDLTTPVPTCGDWTLADLVWHLAEVQDFWTFIIANRPIGPDTYSKPRRPADVELPDLLADRCGSLVELLDVADPTDVAWSWSGDHSVGFTLRRQMHEALIHHVDGVLAVGGAIPDVDPAVAADGVDELVTVMLTGVPAWASFELSTGTVRVVTDDHQREWTLAFGRMTGTSPTSGTVYDIETLESVDDVSDPTTTITGPALDLDLWMWGRGDPSGLTITGDPDGAERLRAEVVESTQ